jgi:hypothetical protein
MELSHMEFRLAPHPRGERDPFHVGKDQEHPIMRRFRLAVGSALLAAALVVSAQAQAPAPKSGATEPTTTTKVQNWSRSKWNAAKREWVKDKAKWDVCNQRATEQHLSGRKSWSFIYDCMKA